VTLERSGVVWLEAETSRYDGADVVLALPDGTEAPSDVPASVVLVWTTALGVHRVDATVRPEAGECRVTLLAPADRHQRREYPRLSLGTPMRISSGAGTCRATLVDVSEVALRARIPSTGGTAPAGPGVGDEVRVAFTVHETGFMLHGTVLRLQESGDPDTVDVVVLLDIPAQVANDLRRNVALARAGRAQDR